MPTLPVKHKIAKTFMYVCTMHERRSQNLWTTCQNMNSAVQACRFTGDDREDELREPREHGDVASEHGMLDRGANAEARG